MRLLAKCIAVVFGLLILVVAIFPMLLSAPTFQKYSLAVINHYLPGELDAKRLHLSWFSGQRVDGLQYTSIKDGYYLSAQEITTDSPLWRLIFFKKLTGTTQISSLNASWKQDGDTSPLTVQEVNGQLRFPNSAQLGVAEFSGKTSLQGSTGDFDVHMNGIQWPVTSHATSPLQVKANLVNFPVDILEVIISASKPEMKGLFKELFGERLNLAITQKYNNGEASLLIQATGGNQLVLNIEGTVVPGDHITINRGELDLKVTPRAARLISPSLAITNDSSIHAQIAHSNIPWHFIQESKKASPLELQASITISGIALQELKLNNLVMKIQALPQNEMANVQISGNLLRQNIDTNFRANFELEKPTCNNDLKVCELPAQALIALESSQLSIPELRLKLLEKVTWKKLASLTSLSAHLTSDKVTLRNSELTQEIVLKDVNIPFEYAQHGHRKNIAFKLDAADEKGSSSITSKGALTLPSGSFNWKVINLILSANFKQFPVTQLIRIIDSDTSAIIGLTIGEMVNGNLLAELKEGHGPLQFQLDGSRGSFVLNGKLTDGVLELLQPFTAETAFSPDAVTPALKKRFPFLSLITSVETPLKINIENGSIIPLDPFNPEKLKITQGTLDLGRITVKNRGQVRDLLNLFQANSKGDISIWFTPTYFKVDDGLVQVKRMDMLLANLYPIATWGKIDLLKNRLSLIIGITGPALSNAVGVALDNNYMLQLSLKGTVQQPRLEKEKAAMQLGALIAQSKGTTEGMIVGTLLDLANGKLKEGKVPTPMTDPLPWGDVVQKSNVQQNSAEAKSDKSPIKQLEKQATSILNQLLKS